MIYYYYYAARLAVARYRARPVDKRYLDILIGTLLLFVAWSCV